MSYRNNRSRFGLSNAERIGIFWLLGFMITLILIKSQFTDRTNDPPRIPHAKMKALQCELEDLAYQDSLRRLPRIDSFNPNFLSADKAYRLGMTATAHDRLLIYREQDLWIRSAKEFQQVTGVTDSILNRMAPHFRFPTFEKHWQTAKPAMVLDKRLKRDINQATAKQLEAVYGIGSTYASRILKHIKRFGPFRLDRDLYRVFAIRPEAIDSLLVYFEVKGAPVAPKLELWEASASDLATIPGVDFEMAKDIWSFVRLRDSLASKEELLKIEGMTLNKLRRIELYLMLEKP